MNIPKEISRVDINNIQEELLKSMENKMNTFAEKIENLELSNDDTSNESVKYSLQIGETELNVNNQTHFYFYFLKITHIPKTSSFPSFQQILEAHWVFLLTLLKCLSLLLYF